MGHRDHSMHCLRFIAVAVTLFACGVTSEVRVGTLQSSLSGYFLAVFEDNDVYAAGLHETASADAQLWSYDESTGLIIARGMEYALTADAALDVQLRDKVEESDDDESAQRWVITITNHIVCLRNGKSVTFSSPKEGMPVRLMATSEKNRNQQWIFGATPAPTPSPTRPPSFHKKKKKHKQPNKSSSQSSVWFWLKAISSLGSLAACAGLSVWIWRKVEAAAAATGGGSSEPEKDDDNGGPENRKMKKRPVKPSNPSGVPNPFENRDVEMAQFPSNEDDGEDNDDTVPLVEREGAAAPDDASGKQRGGQNLPFVFDSLNKQKNKS